MRKFLGRHKILLGMELLAVILCGIFCFTPEKLIFFADAAEIADRMAVDGPSGYYRSEEIVLSPGVYRLRAHGEDHEGTWYFTVSSEESTYQALRCNETSVPAHGRDADLEIYVADRVDTAFVSYKYVGETGQPLGNIGLYRTGIGWRVLTFILLFAATAVNLLVRMRESGIKKEQGTAVWVLGLCVLLAYLPYATDYFSYGTDTQFYLLRIEGLKETLLHGRQFPVWAQENRLYGHGYGGACFRGDLFLLFPALLRIIGFPLMDAYKLFVLAVLAGTAGTAWYAFYRCSGSRCGALLGSALYELAPYHIYSIYHQGAVDEFLGMMFLPLVLCGIYRIYTGNRAKPDYVRAKIPLIVGISGILHSHIPMGVALAAVLLLAAAVMWRTTLQKETLRELAKAALGCILVNAWLWVASLGMFPGGSYGFGESMGHKPRFLGTGLAGILQIYPHAGGEAAGLYNRGGVCVGAAFWVMLLCLLVLRLWRTGRGKEYKGGNPWDKTLGWSVALGLLFSLGALPLANLFLAFAASFFVLWLREEKKGWAASVGDAVTAGCFLAVGVVALWAVLYQVDDISHSMNPVRLYTAQSLVSAHVGSGEYLPMGMSLQEPEKRNALQEAVRREPEKRNALQEAVRREPEKRDALPEAVRREPEKRDALPGAGRRSGQQGGRV